MKGYKVCVNRQKIEIKKIREMEYEYTYPQYVLVELEIPDDAIWFKPEFEQYDPWTKVGPEATPLGNIPNVDNKCRANKAIVTKIHGGYDEVYSLQDSNFKYKVGETVKPLSDFDEDPTYACSSGIHFFLTKEEAVKYAPRLYIVIVDKEVPEDAPTEEN